MYRDDLEAALARNAMLQRRVAELERRVTHTSPPQPRAAQPRARHGQVIYAPPATWLPLYGHLVHSIRHAWRSLVAKVPTWERPRWTSSILVVDLLARPAAWLAACVAALAMTVWFALGVLWFVPALAISIMTFVLGSIAVVPVIALASLRRHDSSTQTRGLQWGATRPSDDAPDMLFLFGVMAMSALNVPLSLWLLN